MASTEGHATPRAITVELQLEEIVGRVRRIANDAERVDRKLNGPRLGEEHGLTPDRELSIQSLLDDILPQLARAENALSRVNESLGDLHEKPIAQQARAARG